MIRMIIRILGGAVGLLEILVGIFLVYRYWPEAILKLAGGISLIGMGSYFLNYAITGRTKLKNQ